MLNGGGAGGECTSLILFLFVLYRDGVDCPLGVGEGRTSHEPQRGALLSSRNESLVLLACLYKMRKRTDQNSFMTKLPESVVDPSKNVFGFCCAAEAEATEAVGVGATSTAALRALISFCLLAFFFEVFFSSFIIFYRERRK